MQMSEISGKNYPPLSERSGMPRKSFRRLWIALAVTLGSMISSYGVPTMQIIYPRAGSEVEGSINLRVYAHEGGNVALIDSVKFFRKTASDSSNKTALIKIASTGEWSGSWKVPAAVSGADTLVFRAFNTTGGKTDSTIIVTAVSNGAIIAPTVNITSPAAGSAISGIQTISFTAAAGSGSIAATDISVDGAAYVSTSTTTTHNLNTVPLVEGSHTVRIRITNSGGTATESKITTYFVTNLPAVSWISPNGGTSVSGRMILNYTDTARGGVAIASDSLWVDGQSRNALKSPNGPDTVDVTSLSDGAHTFQIKVTDANGKVGFSTLKTLMTKNNPTADIDSALADSTVFGTLVIRFNVQAVSPAVVATRQISIDGGAFVATDGVSTDTVDTRKLTEGAHTAQIRVVDDKGKVALSRLVKFNVRNAPSVKIQSPIVGDFVKGTVTVRFQVTPVAPDTIKTTQVSIGGGDWISATTDSTYTLDTKDFKDGNLRFQVRVIDGSGKSTVTLVREIMVDNAAPKISYPTIGYPDNVAWGRTGVQVQVTAQGLDLGSGMDKDSALVLGISDLGITAVIMHDDGINGDKVKGDNVFSSLVTLATDTSGSLPFTVRARDALGNDSTVTGALVFDNLRPVLAFTLEPAPGNISEARTGEVYVPNILIQGQFSDLGGSGMKSVQVIVRNDSGDHINNSPETIPLVDGKFRRILELIPGVNRIYLIGSDKAGNVDSVTGKVTYVVPKETKIVTGAGGSVTAADSSGVFLPAGSLTQAKEITVKRVDTQLEPKPLDNRVKLVGVPHEFGPDGSFFPIPVTVTLAYTDADLDPDQDGVPNFDEGKLTLVFWNGTTWIKAGDASVNPARHIVSVQVNHFTLFDIAEDVSVVSPALVTFWDKNPVPGNAEFIYKVPKPGKISLHILDMAGDVVKTLIQPRTHVINSGSVRWDGSNVGGLFSGAGLYVYVFNYSSDDGKVDKLIRKPVGLVRK